MYERPLPDGGPNPAAKARRKLKLVKLLVLGTEKASSFLPGLLHLFQAGLLPECQIVGTSLDELDEEGFQCFVRRACEEFAPKLRRSSDGPGGSVTALGRGDAV